MEIQCPSCQKKLAIGDQFAGQLVKCPACNGVFMAPTLVAPPPPVVVVDAPSPPPIPSAGQDVFPFTSEQPPPRPAFSPVEPPPPPPVIAMDEEPSGPPGEFTRTQTCRLCPDTLRWVGPGALTLVFVLSFFSWITMASAVIVMINDVAAARLNVIGLNLWEISFGDHGTGVWITYVLLTVFLTLPLSWAVALMDLKIIPLPLAVRPYWKWRSALLAGLVALTFLLGLLGRMQLHPNESVSWGMFLSLRAHFVALIAYGLEHWLIDRKKSRLPLPEMTTRW